MQEGEKDWSVKQSNSKLILKLIAKGNGGDNDLSNEKKKKDYIDNKSI